MNEQNDAWIAAQDNIDTEREKFNAKREKFNAWYSSAESPDEGDSEPVYMAWSAWQAAIASVAQNNQVVDDLSALVSRLARALNKAAPTHTLPALVMDYLKRKNLLTNPMRSKFLGDSVDGAYDTFQAAVSQTNYPINHETQRQIDFWKAKSCEFRDKYLKLLEAQAVSKQIPYDHQ